MRVDELRQAEVRLGRAPCGGAFRIVLCYPNLYYVGMSNLGFQGVYRLMNAHPGVSCERAFLPHEPGGRQRQAPEVPRSFESGAPLGDFDLIAFSISFENDYLHVLQMLQRAGVPLRASDRGARDPVILFGGSAMFLNPEPLAPFADVIAVGEGEGLVPELLTSLLGEGGPRRGLEGLREADGFYLPDRHRVRYHADGRVEAYDGPGRVLRRRAWPGSGMELPQTEILTPHTEMSMKFMVEISRGCPCMCRFCWAGYNYLPVRSISREAIVSRARDVRGQTDRIGLVSTAVCDHPEIDGIVDDLAAMDYEVSVASLRLDDLTPEFVFKLADTGVQGLTLAPECGSDRMRRILNKQFTNRDILEMAEWIFERGIQNLKLYYMVGLPFETHADVEAIVELTAGIRERMLRVGRSRGRVGRIHPSVNPFVPKPGTPFQWLPMEDPRQTDRKLQFLRRAFGRMPNVDAICKSARTGATQSALALGDRRLADALEYAAVEGVDLKRGMRASGLDPGFYLFRNRGRDELLPWDVVDNGVSKAYYLRELDRSLAERLSPHCPELQGCIRCGVCEEQPNPGYAMPERWKGLEAPPIYSRELPPRTGLERPRHKVS